jgi:hypothetical protein
MANLTEKQQVWLSEYLQCWNGAEAARRAGYASPYQSAHDNITNPKIKQEIHKRLSLKAMTADEVLTRLADQARFSFDDFFDIDPTTGRPQLNLNKARERGKLHLIKRYWVDKNGHERVEFHDSQRALEMVGRAHLLFKDGLEVTGADGKDLIPDRLSDALDQIYGDDDEDGDDE